MANRIIDTLSVIDKKEVQEIGKEINDTFLVAKGHAEKAIMSYLKVGKLLHDARQFFPGDKEYGQWRAENTTLSQSWANKLLRVHDTYGDKPPASLPISTLAEMTNVSEAKRKELEKQAVDPEQKTPSVRDVKQVAREEKQQMPRAMKERLDKEKAEKKETKSLEEIAQMFVDKGIDKRAAYWDQSEKTVEDAYIVYGLPPFFDGSPNIDTIILLTTALMTEHSDYQSQVNEAYAVIRESLK